MVQRSRTGASPTALVVSAGFVWAAARTPLARHRGGTLRVRHRHIDPGPWASLEPSSYEDVTLKLLSLAHDGLVAYRRTDSSTYGDLVGALATEVPDPSPDGRTYVFKLRAGLRYSDGTAVRPEDFRASMEALVKRFGAKLPRYYDSILGVPACASRPTHCDLSKGIVADAGARTITLRLSEPDPELLDKLAYPFAWVAPANRPFRPRTPVPGTGPYQTARLSLRRGVVLIRNPHFRARDGRPDGLPDQIRFSFTKDFDANVAAVERNAADAVVVASPFESPWSAGANLRARRAGARAPAHRRGFGDRIHVPERPRPSVRPPPSPTSAQLRGRPARDRAARRWHEHRPARMRPRRHPDSPATSLPVATPSIRLPAAPGWRRTSTERAAWLSAPARRDSR